MLQTVVLWIDEAHDLFVSGTPREAGEVLKTLKSLLQGDAAVIVILSGVEELWRVTSFDRQVSRRYAKMILPPVSAAADGPVLSKALTGYCALAGVAPPEDDDLIPRLIHAARGRFGLCLEAMGNAIELAADADEPEVTIHHFARNFAMQEGCEPLRNPFLSSRWSLIDVDPAQSR